VKQGDVDQSMFSSKVQSVHKPLSTREMGQFSDQFSVKR
jgi:hypothetical protein